MIGVVLLFSGWSDDAEHFPAPVTITIDELIEKHPTTGWYNVTDGIGALAMGAKEFDVSKGTLSRDPQAVLFPLLRSRDYPSGPMAEEMWDSSPVYVLVRTRDTATVQSVRSLRTEMDPPAPQEAMEAPRPPFAMNPRMGVPDPRPMMPYPGAMPAPYPAAGRLNQYMVRRSFQGMIRRADLIIRPQDVSGRMQPQCLMLEEGEIPSGGATGAARVIGWILIGGIPLVWIVILARALLPAPPETLQYEFVGGIGALDEDTTAASTIPNAAGDLITMPSGPNDR